MAQAIHKYMLHDVQNVVKLPKDWLVLSVHNQRGYICLWVLVDTEEKETESVLFYAFGTGETPIHLDPVSCVFVGTVLLEEGELVFHVFYDAVPIVDSGIR